MKTPTPGDVYRIDYPDDDPVWFVTVRPFDGQRAEGFAIRRGQVLQGTAWLYESAPAILVGRNYRKNFRTRSLSVV